MKRLLARVLSIKPLTSQMSLVRLQLPQEAEKAQPGQFAHMSVPGDRAHLLRRPISIFSVQGDVLEMGIAPKGEGTRLLLEAQPGDEVDLLYPLGNGFDRKNFSRIAFVGGGIGVAPMRYAMECFAGEGCFGIFGFRSAKMIYAAEACRRTGAEILICTDDGSAGVHGPVTGPLEQLLGERKVDLVMACGPTPMLRAVQKLAQEYGVEAQLSLEEHMGCGIGACLTCNCKVKVRDGETGYKRVCADGPVLEAKEVVFE